MRESQVNHKQNKTDRAREKATMESRSRLKQCLIRLFRPSTLLRTSCNSTTSGSIFTSSATTTNNTNTSSSRSLSRSTTTTTDIITGTATAHEPVFIPHDSLFTRNSSGSSSNKLYRSLPFSSSSRMLSLHCSGCRPTKSSEADVVSTVSKVNEKKMMMKKKERRVRETRELYETGEREGRTCPPASPSSPSKEYYYFDYYFSDKINEEDEDNKQKHKKKKKDGIRPKNLKKNNKIKFASNAYGFSSSSDDDDSEFFSSGEVVDNEDETETFFSSRSFSSDSSEFYRRPSSRKKKKMQNKKQTKSSRRPLRRGKTNHDRFRPVVSVSMNEDHEEEDMTGIPVMKRSTDPYVDFRDSMAEMIVERQIFGAEGLERLLHSYLSLNSPHHHAVILRAFADISEVLFGH